MNTLSVDIIENGIDTTSDGANVVVVYNIFANVHRTMSGCQGSSYNTFICCSNEYFALS